MTYNFGLFIAILSGNVFGYILFNLIMQQLFYFKNNYILQKEQQKQDSFSQPRVYHLTILTTEFKA